MGYVENKIQLRSFHRTVYTSTTDQVISNFMVYYFIILWLVLISST